MLSKISWPTLTLVAGGAGMGVGVMILLLNKEREKFANQANFIKSAVSMVHEQPAALSLLGGNFKVGQASFQDGWSKIERLEVRVRVPLKGTIDNGSLYVYAKKKDEEAKLRLCKIEMSFDKVPGKKLILMEYGDDILETEASSSQSDSEVKQEQVLSGEERAKKLDLQLNPRNYHPTMRINKPTT